METDPIRYLTSKVLCRVTVVAVAYAGLMLVPQKVAWADYYHPTNVSDCNIWSSQYQFSEQKRQLRSQVQQCLKNASGANWITIPVCGYPGARSCAAIESQQCQLEETASRLRDNCMAKLESYRQQEARKRAEQEAARRAEQAARLAEEAAREEAYRFNVQSGRIAANGNIRPSIKTPGDMVQYVRHGGTLFGKRIGIPPSQMGGAYHLSGALSAVGIRYLQGTQENVMRSYDKAMTAFEKPSFEEIVAAKNTAQRTHGESALRILEDGLTQSFDNDATKGSKGKASEPYSRNNPRPTQAQSDRTRDEFVGRTVSTAFSEGRLPFGGESAVLGENARYVTDIAQGRADGRLGTPLYETDMSDAANGLRSSGGGSTTQGANSGLRDQRGASLREIRGSIGRQSRQVATRARQSAAHCVSVKVVPASNWRPEIARSTDTRIQNNCPWAVRSTCLGSQTFEAGADWLMFDSACPITPSSFYRVQ